MKDELRKKSIEIRKALNTEVLSEQVMKNLFDTKNIKCLRIYYAIIR